MLKIGLLIAGYKGFSFLEKFQHTHLNVQIDFVASYETKGTLHNSFEYIHKLCLKNNLSFFKRSDLTPQIFDNADIIFIAGWQYLIDAVDERFIVLHDSLLPKLRGFAPTATALILGKDAIGITALKPIASTIDTGEIYSQVSIPIEYPIRIQDAYLLLADAYVEAVTSIIFMTENGELKAYPQDESEASYSIWRDERDYYIDWGWDAEKIVRFIDAVSYPYYGAKTLYKSQVVYIDRAIVTPDLNFEDRHAGKIWRLNHGLPQIICGTGMVQILSARQEDNSPMVFSRLRERLTRPV